MAGCVHEVTKETLADVGPAAVLVVLSWWSDNPYAIELRFLTKGRATNDDVVWVISRELLAEGMDFPAGIGDVHICPVVELPCCDDHCDDHVADTPLTELRLRSPSGRAEVQFDTNDLSEFLDSTAQLIPIDEESARGTLLDIDEELYRMIDDDRWSDPGHAAA